MTDTSRKASTDHPVHELISTRWSPYVLDSKPIAGTDLKSIFEAARWAASSYNEQPWSFIVGTKDGSPAIYEKVLSCLVEPNQAWAHAAPVLALGVASLRFKRNDKPNGVALHDLGTAAAQLTFEATARGICVHQMGGILPDRAAEIFAVPEGHQVVTGIALGYAGDPANADAALVERDQGERTRRPLSEFVFGESFGSAASL